MQHVLPRHASHATCPPPPPPFTLSIEQDHKERTQNNQGGSESAIDLVAYVEFQRSLRCVPPLSSIHMLSQTQAANTQGLSSIHMLSQTQAAGAQGSHALPSSLRE